jgi:hypothetical protein
VSELLQAIDALPAGDFLAGVMALTWLCDRCLR